MKNKIVYIAMSGGVDSAVSALLLKRAGFVVKGIFVKTWTPDYIECTQKEDRLDAMRVCAQLDIPFITLDLEKEYKKFVIDYFLEEYKNNNVPNPDIMCNKFIKFGGLLDYCLANGADYLATGHYAKIDLCYLSREKRKSISSDLLNPEGSDTNPHKLFSFFSFADKRKSISSDLLNPEGSDTNPHKLFSFLSFADKRKSISSDLLRNVANPNINLIKSKKSFSEYFYEAINKYMLDIGHYMRPDYENKEYLLTIPQDKNKDQTYFLYQIDKNKLDKIIFPLADLEKPEVRKIAKENNLWVQDKKDSQGICMLGGEIGVKDFLKRELSVKSGEVLDINNNVIGSHDGVELYTLGERRGFNIFNDKTDSHSHYIIEKKADKNQLIVSENYNNLKVNDKYLLKDVNYLINDLSIFEEIVSARFRYRGDFVDVKYNTNNNSLQIINNKENDFLPISGQSVVFYKNEICLGGGIIE